MTITVSNAPSTKDKSAKKVNKSYKPHGLRPGVKFQQAMKQLRRDVNWSFDCLGYKHVYSPDNSECRFTQVVGHDFGDKVFKDYNEAKAWLVEVGMFKTRQS